MYVRFCFLILVKLIKTTASVEILKIYWSGGCAWHGSSCGGWFLPSIQVLKPGSKGLHGLSHYASLIGHSLLCIYNMHAIARLSMMVCI